MTSKRKALGDNLLEGPSKRSRTSDPVRVDEEDDVAAIWAQIQAQEAAAESSGHHASTTHGAASQPLQVSSGGGDDDVDAIWAEIVARERAEPAVTESDEELARRLAAEWQAEEAGGPSHPIPKGRNVSSASGDSCNAKPYPDPKQSLLAHRELCTRERACSKCGSPVESRRGFVMFGTAIPPPTLLYVLHAPCSNCSNNHCRGCFTSLSCKSNCKGRDGCHVLDCCAEVRAIAMFEALGGLDRKYISSKQGPESSAPTKKVSKTTGAGGTGYGMDDYHPGYRGRSQADTSSHKWQSQSGDSDANFDTTVIRAFKTISSLLPDPSSEHIYDMLPHPSIRPLLTLSYVPEILRELLRNDSVNEWTRRGDVYSEMIQFLRRLADSELSVEILVSDGWEKKSSQGIDEFIWDMAGFELETTAPPERLPVRTPALYQYFQKLVRQCDAFLSLASSGGGVNVDDAETEEMTIQAQALCLNIMQAQDDIARTVEAWARGGAASSSKGKTADRSVSLEQSYAAACERLAFKHATLSSEGPNGGLSYPTHLFGKELKATASSTRVPKQRLHLIKELSVMATSLPPGIWVRVDDIRNDAIKIMIAGPEGTPYAGGLFEFDCFMPLAYPNESPKVLIRTTAGGRVRFNPNLYSNGKVCLSLLGTWPGRPEEQWSPKTSTLLQVLISIQSMILVDCPYFNEPGHGSANPASIASINYNKNIALQNVRWAMLEWMTEDGRTGLWADVIYSHFTLKKGLIRAQIKKWATEDSHFRNYAQSSTANGGTSHRPQVAKGKEASVDLPAEFDRRMQQVERWKV